jgi:hypothetical protein
VRHPTIAATILIAATMAALPCWSQDTTLSEVVFTNPGARSIALGGAFAAIADDATAAFANPAGLVQIVRPEISAEVRVTGSSGPFNAEYTIEGGVSGLGFISVVVPRRRWAFALYSHQLGSLDFTFNGPIPQTREFTVRSYSGAAAFQVSDDLSFGAGVSYFDGDRTTEAGPAEISDADWGLNAGVLWSPSTDWNLAGFYRQGPGFESSTAPTQLTFPDVYGLGAAFQPNAGALTIGFEWDQVGESVDPLPNGSIVTEGGSQIHIGAEYAVLRWKPVVAFRIGLWHEPGRDRRLTIEPDVVDITTTDARSHFAFGFGLAFKRFQIDAGLDTSEGTAIGSLSIVYSF